MSPLSAEQLLMRQSGIGASEASAVLGLDPFRKPIDVWAEKCGEAEPFLGNEHTELGDLLEPVMGALYAKRTGRSVLKAAQTFRHPEHSFILATPDFLAGDRLVECKSTVLTDHWGAPELGADGLPPKVHVQLTIQQAVTQLFVGDVAAFVGGRFRIHADIGFDADYFGDIAKLLRDFWETYCLTGRPPPPDASEQYTSYLKSRPGGNTGHILPATPEVAALFSEYWELRQQAESADKAKTEVEQKLRALVGEADGIAGLCRYKRSKPREVTDWESVALAMSPPLQLIKKHTETKPGARPFVPLKAKEQP
jgi:putative phage-type endonuclease